MKNEYNYYAFISYNNRDEKWAQKIQYQLQHYRLPSLARKEIGEDVKIRPVFRYVTNLGPGDLHENLGRELESSKYLIVICSPNSAQPNIQGKHWVNDEITRFINLGRRDRIIPVIVGGTPNSGDDKECFPPALRNADIAGVDITVGTTKERHHAFLKIVAKLLDLKPEILTRYVEDEDKAIKRRGWWRMAPILALCAIGGLFAWDSTRTVKNYYANYVDSFGLPQGIFQLKQSELAGRGIHYRFEYRGYGWGKSIHVDSSGWSPFKWLGFYRVLRRVVQAHSSGTPTEWGHTEYAKRSPVQEFEYEKEWPNVGKRVSTIIYKDRTGKFTKRLELSEGKDGTTNGLLEFFGEKGKTERLFAKAGATTLNSENALSSRTNTEIAQHEFRRDGRGRILEVRFLNVYRVPVADDDGIYGFDFQNFDEYGRYQEQWYIGLDGSGKLSRTVNKNGVGGKRYAYLGRNMTRAEYVDSTGRPIMGPHGWMVCADKFDSFDNNIESTFLDEKGNVALLACGVAGYKAKYDEVGNHVSQTYYDTACKPTLHVDGNAGWIAEYDERGRETRNVWIGVDGKPTLHKDGYAEYRVEYDERGNVTKVSYFGVDGKPTLHVDGYAGWIAEYDERGRETRRVLIGVDGKPTLHKDGYAEYRVEYDERGNVKKISSFGVDGKPTLHKDGYFVICKKYDTARGNMTKESYFGVDGKPTLHVDGNAGWIAEYDERGRETRNVWIGVDGKPTLHKDGYAEYRKEYDGRGNPTKESYFDENGHLVVGAKGFSVANVEYDDRGNVVKESYYGTDGKPILHQLGIAGYIAQYDDYGHRIMESYFGVDGKPTLLKDGYAECRVEYDARGNETKRSCFGVDGNPVVPKDGVTEWRREYDAKGNEIKSLYFGVDGKPTLHKDGIAGLIAEYDERGRETRRVLIGVDGKPTLLKDGYAECRVEYDARGNVTKKSYFGVDGKPMMNKDGYAMVRFIHKPDGTVVGAEYFDICGKAIVWYPVGISAEVLPNFPAAQLGVQEGDVWCRLGAYDILKTDNLYDLAAPLQASRNVEKELIVARKVGEEYEIHAFKFPVGLMGIRVEEKKLSDFDKLKQAYKAYCEKEGRPSP